MNAIISGRSGRALIVDGESLKSFDIDDPSMIVPRRKSELAYLFGEASDLRAVAATSISSIARELTFDCHFTWALDLALISLDSELPEDIREEALDGLEELLVETLVREKLENVLYSHPLPDDSDLVGALKLCEIKAFSAAEDLL